LTIEVDISYFDHESKGWFPEVVPAASLHIVLALLDGELHGYAVMQRVGELSDGAVKMGPGTLYGTLNRLVDDGLVVETTDRVEPGENERRRYYELSASGRSVALVELARLRTLVDRVTRTLDGGAIA
jgi:DNA-binding PadR family transcriptional regulator